MQANPNIPGQNTPHPLDSSLEATILQNNDIIENGKEANALLEALVVHSQQNELEPILEAQIVQSDKNNKELVGAIKELKPELEKSASSTDRIVNFLEQMKGEDGHTPTEEELIALIEPRIPEPIKGEDGKTPTPEELVELIEPIVEEKMPTDEKLVELITPLIPPPIKPRDGIDGQDADEDIIVEKVLKKIPKPKPVKEIKLDGGEEIVAKLEKLKGDKRLDKSAIKGLDKMQKEIDHVASFGSSGQEYRVAGTKVSANSQTLNFIAGSNTTITGTPTSDGANITITTTGGGGVQSVVAGTNISVNNTDPANPVVNSLSDRYKTTSTTSHTIVSSGSLTFTVDSNLSYIPLQEVLIVHDTNNHMHGTVSSYSGTTLIVDIKHKTGSGTYNSWNINLDGTPVDAITGSGTTNEIAYFTGGQTIASLPTATYPSLTELARVKGVTSSIQTQLDGKQPLDTGLTRYSVPFIGSGGLLSQQNDRFIYDEEGSLYVSTNVTERLLNGSFSGSATSWTLASGWAYSANSVSKTSNGTGALSQSVPLRAGMMVRVRFTLSNFTAGTVTVFLGNSGIATLSSAGTYTYYRTIGTSATGISFTPSNTARLTVDDVSLVEISGGGIRAGQVVTKELNISEDRSNGQPGTTRHIKLDNNGLNTWIESYFGGVLRNGIGFSSSNRVTFFTSSGGDFAWYDSPSVVTPFMSATAGGLSHEGILAAKEGIKAGNSSLTLPPSTLTTVKSFGAKHELITNSIVLNGDYTYVNANGDNSSICAGTPTTDCTSYTNQTDCEARDSHGGCTWNVYECNTFDNESGMTQCAGQAGCTVVTTSCSGAADETACLAQDDTYGGACSWDEITASCSTYNADETTCGNTSGCTQDYTACSWDGSNCQGGGNCGTHNNETDCNNATYFSSCSGTYNTGTFACNGSYNTGSCSGTFGDCTGTASCGGIDDETNCNNESGCTFTTGITLTTPTESTFSTNFLRTYFIRNIGSTANVTVVPNTNQTVNGTTSLTIAPGKARHISLAYHTADCSVFTNLGACTAQTGCSWDSENLTCSGTYTVIRDWSVYGGVF